LGESAIVSAKIINSLITKDIRNLLVFMVQGKPPGMGYFFSRKLNIPWVRYSDLNKIPTPAVKISKTKK